MRVLPLIAALSIWTSAALAQPVVDFPPPLTGPSIGAALGYAPLNGTAVSPLIGTNGSANPTQVAVGLGLTLSSGTLSCDFTAAGIAASLPTSSVGLTAGSLWNNGGVISVAP